MLALFITIVIYVTITLSNIIYKIHFDVDNIVGISNSEERMLNNFVEDGIGSRAASYSGLKLKRSNVHHNNNTDGIGEVESISHDEHPPVSNIETMLDDKRMPTYSNIDKLVDRSLLREVPDDERSLAFVHIGKSGGSTISLLLRNGCMTAADGLVPCEPERWKKIQEVESTASKRIDFYLHTPHVESGKMARYYKRVTSVVVVVRDPLDRFLSAFLSRHPRNIDATRVENSLIRRKYEAQGKEPPIWAKVIWGGGDAELDQVHRAAFTGCYPTVEELVNCASGVPIRYERYNTTITWLKRGRHSKEISLPCRSICKDIVNGDGKYIHHVRFNYEAFLKDLPSQTEVFVIRTKNLWPDWIQVNRLLGSTQDVTIPDDDSGGKKVNARGKKPVRSNLSDRGQEYVCEHFLKNDIRRYIDIMNRAVNLSDEDVMLALEELKENCPLVVKNLAKG